MSRPTFLHDHSLTFPKLKQHNLEVGRCYSVLEGAHQGRVYPSITRILAHKDKPFLAKWKKKVGVDEAERIRNKAQARGNAIHALAEDYLNNNPLVEPWAHVQELWTTMRGWIDLNITKVYAQEQNVFSATLGVAGRMDLLADVKGVMYVGDFKNSLKPKREEWVQDYYLQGTFYALAVQELTGQRVRHIIFPVVHPEGIQVFETTPGKHLDELIDRVDDFYTDMQQAALPESTALKNNFVGCEKTLDDGKTLAYIPWCVVAEAQASPEAARDANSKPVQN